MSSNSSAVSNIVIYYGGEGGSGTVTVTNDYGFTLVDNQSELALITNPEEIRLVFIKNGTNGATDVAFWNPTTSTWDIRRLEGVEGAVGDEPAHEWSGTQLRFRNPNGTWGVFVDLQGLDGADGTNGINGTNGSAPAHEWQGTAIRFRNPNGSWGVLVELKGTDGTDGTDGLNGLDGAKGDRPDHQWSGSSIRFQKPDGSWGEYVELQGASGQPTPHQWLNTSLRFQNPDGTWGNYVDLQGIQGIKGDTGLAPAHEWLLTQLRFQNPDGSWGAYTDLIGQRGLAPAHQILGTSIRFQNPDGTWGAYLQLDNIGDIYYGAEPPLETAGENAGSDNVSIIWAKPADNANGFDFHLYNPNTLTWVNILGSYDNILKVFTFKTPKPAPPLPEETVEEFSLSLAATTINNLSYQIAVGSSEIGFFVTYYEGYLYTLRMVNRGTGLYGFNGSIIDANDLYLVKREPVSLESLLGMPTTNTIDFTNISQALYLEFSEMAPSQMVQATNLGFTAIRVYSETNGVETLEESYIFTGTDDLLYGFGDANAVAADFYQIPVGISTDIPTKTSSLINDGEDGINPFLDELDKTELQTQITTNRTDIDNLLGGAGDGFKYLQIAYIDGYTFSVTAEWVIGGIAFPRITVEITASNSDPLFDRIDSIVADNTGAIFFRMGVAESNPSKPTIDPLTELEATFVYISAGSTAPDGFTSAKIYDENLQVAGGEWDTLAVKGATGTINLASPNFPASGTVCIEATGLAQFDGIRFTPNTPLAIADIDQITYNIRNKAGNYGNGDTHRFMLYGLDAQGNLITVVLPADPNYKNNITQNQLLTLTIPTNIAIVTINYIMMLNYATTNKAFGFYLDAIHFSTVSPETPTNTGEFATVAYVDQRDNLILANLAAKEDKVNKVQNFSAPSATTYPSTQAVVTYVQANKDKNYVHSQGTPTNTWVIAHNLAKYPSVHVKDSAGTVVEGDIDYTDLNNLTITFNGSFSGEATLN